MCGGHLPSKASKEVEAAGASIREKVSGYSLSDVETLHNQNPTTFRIPSLHERNNLGKGTFAKLIFSPGERMWVEVTQVGQGPIYTGKLANTPTLSKLKQGDEITFAPHHVCGIEYKTTEKSKKRLALGRG